MKRSLPEKPLEHLFPPKKRMKHTKPENEKTIFQGTVVKKLNWKKLCFVMPDEGQESKAEALGIKSKGDVLLREDAFGPGVFHGFINGARVCYWELSANGKGKLRAGGAEIIANAKPITLTHLKLCREGKRNEGETVYKGTVVRVNDQFCFARPDEGANDVMLRADCFAEGVFDKEVKVNVRVNYWDTTMNNKKLRANGAEISEDQTKVEPVGALTGVVVKKLNCICFVKPDSGKSDVLVRADAFEQGVFDSTLQEGHRVSYWNISTGKKGKERADNAEIIRKDNEIPVADKTTVQSNLLHGKRTENDKTSKATVVKMLENFCFARPDGGKKDVLIRADSFATGVYDTKVKVGMRVLYWGTQKQGKKIRANGAEVCEDQTPFEVEKYMGTVIKKLNRVCFVKPDDGKADVLVRADAFEEEIFDALLAPQHRVAYWNVSKLGEKVRADAAELVFGDLDNSGAKPVVHPLTETLFLSLAPFVAPVV